MKPERIQRQRTKGWKMPADTVSVTRPSRWGNPFRVGDFVKLGDPAGAHGWMAMAWCRTSAEYADDRYTEIKTNEDAVAFYRKAMALAPPMDIAKLRGKNLACFCKLGESCHADVLLELANTEVRDDG